ncbi:hypothetical protein D9611_001902 [Ephemerocybe angulata]|uniref:Myb-like domain-containing protein n=1 Tax=Ephemerocybe angulata TaxID=980116 RepID=A0A8H5CI06_9AGAR|nr:hypothetical protein D9611_001902 [Tulosesus angulatus]
MDNPQHYQPLSHALHPPLGTSQSRSPYPPSSVFTPPSRPATVPGTSGHRDDQEEEEDQEDDDEGIVEGQLELHDNDGERPGSGPPSPPRLANAGHAQPALQIVQDMGHVSGGEKRRPGRPRGSKNRKPRAPPGAGKETQPTNPALSGPPPHPDINAQNQQYYEFQWRILNLCAEFYGAAEELVKSTNPLVIAQCYHMGPAAKLDPLVMLGEAKRICDGLLANPSQLVMNPPPPMYPALPTLYSSGLAPPPTSAPGAASTSTPSAPVITNPQTFVVSLGAGQPYPAPQYSGYAPGQYAPTPYYQYPYAPHGHPPPPPGYYPPPPPVASGSGTPSHIMSTTPHMPVPGATSATPTPAPIVASGSTSSGAWTDDETEKLRHLAENSKAASVNGEIDWEHVIRNFGDKRTRHQILIKATNMGLKESSTRGSKRRRGDDAGGEVAPGTTAVAAAPTTSPAMGSLPSQPAVLPQNTHSSPSQSHNSQHVTPHASPALQNIQRPSSSSASATATATAVSGKATPAAVAPPGMPWPMPTVAAVGAASPIIPGGSSAAGASSGHDPQRTSYYRPRPNQGSDPAAKAGSGHQQQQQHHFSMYTPNGHGTRQTDSR